MTDHSTLRTVLLAATPVTGESIGNPALFERSRRYRLDLSHESDANTCDSRIVESMVAKWLPRQIPVECTAQRAA